MCQQPTVTGGQGTITVVGSGTPNEAITITITPVQAPPPAPPRQLPDPNVFNGNLDGTGNGTKVIDDLPAGPYNIRTEGGGSVFNQQATVT